MTTLVLRDVRIAFPELWEATQFDGQGEHRYSTAFLVDPASETHKKIEAMIDQVAAAKWGVKAKAKLAGLVGIPNKFCYMDGHRKADYAGFAGNMALSATRKLKDGRPVVVDRNKSPITAEDGKIYAGCYVNATVDIWAQDGTYPGIRATIINVQFVKDGESFGGAAPASDVGLDDLGYSEDTDEDLI